jgi:hypothetical protein
MDMSAALNRIEEEIRKSPYHRGVFDSSCEGGKLNPRTEGHGGRRGGRGPGAHGVAAMVWLTWEKRRLCVAFGWWMWTSDSGGLSRVRL